MKCRARNISIAVILSLLINICLAGCWNSRELNTLAFITSIGFDKTDNGILLTIQVLNPRAIAAQKPINESAVVVFTEEGKDPIEMIRKMITQSSRKLNGTHLRTVVFGEAFAKEGISDVLDLLSREHQFRTDVYFAIAKGSTANEILNTLARMETNPSEKLYNSIKSSNEIWAGTKSEKSISLINAIISDGMDPVLTGIELTEHSKTNSTTELLEEIKNSPLKIADLAVFQNDKFIGWLNEDESKGFNFIIGNVQGTMGHIENQSVGKIAFEITDVKSKQVVSFENGKPVINVNVDIKANIESASTRLDITKEENIKIIEKFAEKEVTGFCIESINKAQKKFSSDVFGFGEVIHRHYPKQWESLKDDWNSTFKDLPVKVNVKLEIDRTGIIGNSLFIKEKK